MEEVSIFTKKLPSVKETYFAKVGVAVTLDYFLYTCYELEYTYRSLGPKQTAQINKQRWPILFDAPDFSDENLESILSNLLDWYKATYPAIAEEKTLDYITSSELLSPFVLLAMDVSAAVEKKTGLHSPFLNDADLAKAESSSEATEDETKGLQAWRTVAKATEIALPHFASYLNAYFRWCFHRAAEKRYDLASLPPVGRFLPMLYRSQRHRDNKRGGHGNRSSGSHHNAPSFPSRSKNENRDRRPKPAANTGSMKPAGKGRSRVPELSETEEREHQNRQEALNEVKRGCKELEKNPSMDSYLLAPQNSYVRRLQHQLVGECGFESVSEGEGANRAIKIVRSK